MLVLYKNKPRYGKSGSEDVYFKVNPDGKTGIEIEIFTGLKQVCISTAIIPAFTYNSQQSIQITRKEFLAKLKEVKRQINSIRA